jgi:hypothetical protein
VSAAHTNLFALELNERESVPVPPTEESELPPPPKKLKGLFHRRKSIGRRKDGRQKKTGSYDYADVRVSHGLNSTARSQEVLSAVVGTRGEGSTAIVPTPLKTELQRDLKKAIASNLKYAASTECLKKENEIRKKKISSQEEKMKALVEDRCQLRGEKRSLEKDYHARLKEVCEERQTLKIELIQENRLLRKSYNAEVKKRGLLEVKSVRDNDKITNLKRTNNQLLLDIRRERQASNFIIDDAMVEARRLSADALEMMAKANDTIHNEREKTAARLHEERAHHSKESERL